MNIQTGRNADDPWEIQQKIVHNSQLFLIFGRRYITIIPVIHPKNGQNCRNADKEEVFVISNQVLQSTLDGLKNISRVDLCVMDTEGILLASTFDGADHFRDSVISFAGSPADSQVISGYQFFKVLDENQLELLPEKLVKQAGAIAQKVMRELIINNG